MSVLDECSHLPNSALGGLKKSQNGLELAFCINIDTMMQLQSELGPDRGAAVRGNNCRTFNLRRGSYNLPLMPYKTPSALSPPRFSAKLNTGKGFRYDQKLAFVIAVSRMFGLGGSFVSSACRFQEYPHGFLVFISDVLENDTKIPFT